MLSQRSITTRNFKPVLAVAPPSGTAAGAGDAISMMGAPLAFKRNEEIYGDGEPSDFLYKVTAGTVRTYKVLDDGRRQIGSFYIEGDVFGLENGETHGFSAEAVTECRVLVVKRSALVTLAARDVEVAQLLWAVTARELQRAQDHFLALVKTAEERVASFLLEMAARLTPDNQFELAMTRQDIADYLGLTIETVCRTMTQLESAAAIELPSARRVVLRNRAALARCCA